MSTEPMTLWHASRADIDRPTIAGRTQGDHHANSGLGIFCATGPHDYIGGFGGTIHALEIKSDAKIIDMTIGDLAKMSRDPRAEDGERDRAWFDAEGRRLAENYDLIRLIEDNGFSSQSIILRDEAIVSSQRMTAEQFKEVSRDLFAEMREFEKNAAIAKVRSKGPAGGEIDAAPVYARRRSAERD